MDGPNRERSGWRPANTRVRSPRPDKQRRVLLAFESLSSEYQDQVKVAEKRLGLTDANSANSRIQFILISKDSVPGPIDGGPKI